MKKGRIKKIFRISDNNEGAAGIIVAVMLIGLFFTFLSVIQLTYIPDWSEEREAEHMEKVAEQFTQLKFAVDVLSSIEQIGNKITTAVTLGTNEIPLPLFLKSEKSFGYLKLISDECMINITDKTPSSYNYILGSIRYSPRNSRYIETDYIYEAGGIITSQKLGNTMYIMPYFSVDYSGNVVITYETIDFIDIAGKKYTTGHGISQIQLEYKSKNTDTINNVDDLIISTHYMGAWHNFFNDTLGSAGLTYGAANDFEIIENEIDNEITIDFNDALTVDLTLIITEINIQIGPGWSN
ncbi:MAG: hypothetical protein AYK22_02775 [Thermoplasmatales archaeon SG8-52-3]|nr:MAG: hypothetical protein AYK22_02775 [Thermoplasmatales archaeon SG8-52-3]